MVTVGLGRRRSYSFFAISISLITHALGNRFNTSFPLGSVQPANPEVEDPYSGLKCIDSERNVTVSAKRSSKEECKERCCFNKADHLLICSTPGECEKLQVSSCLVPLCRGREPQEQPGGWGNWVFVVFVIVFTLTTAAYRKYKANRKLKKRENNVRQKLDMEFPPQVFGKVDNIETQSDDGDVCCICLDGLEGTTVRKLHCSHVLHQVCFDKWCLHSSDPTTRKGLDKNVPEEQLWACPFCKHPAMPDARQASKESVEMVTVAEQVQALTTLLEMLPLQARPHNPGEVSEDEQPEAIVEQPPTQGENSIPR